MDRTRLGPYLTPYEPGTIRRPGRIKRRFVISVPGDVDATGIFIQILAPQSQMRIGEDELFRVR